MTVKELIVKLLEMPLDADVIYDCCSDYADLPEPTMKEVAFRNGEYKDLQRKWYPPEEEPVFRIAVHFRGN